LPRITARFNASSSIGAPPLFNQCTDVGETPLLPQMQGRSVLLSLQLGEGFAMFGYLRLLPVVILTGDSRFCGAPTEDEALLFTPVFSSPSSILSYALFMVHPPLCPSMSNK